MIRKGVLLDKKALLLCIANGYLLTDGSKVFNSLGKSIIGFGISAVFACLLCYSLNKILIFIYVDKMIHLDKGIRLNV